MSAALGIWGLLLAAALACLAAAVSWERTPAGAPGGVALALGALAAFQAVVADLLHRQASRVGGGALRGAAVASWVLDVAITLYAPLLAMLGFPPRAWGGFGVVGVVLLVLHRPRRGPGSGSPGLRGAGERGAG